MKKEKLMKQFGISDEREWQIFSKGMDVVKSHCTSSDDTIKRFEVMEKKLEIYISRNEDEHKNLNEIISKIDNAMFGNDNDKDDKGTVKMTKEMYNVFTSSGLSGKIIIKFFAGLGIITGAIIGIIELAKRIK